MEPLAFVSTFSVSHQRAGISCRPHCKPVLAMKTSTNSRATPRFSLARLALSVALALSFKGATHVHAHEPLPGSPSSVANTIAMPSMSNGGHAAVAVVLNSRSSKPTPKEVKQPTKPKSTGEKDLELLSTKNSTPKLGEKLATKLRRAGVPDAAIVLILSALPVVELRAGIPVGFLLGLPAWQTFLLAICGNLLPVLPLLYLLRLPPVQRSASWVLTRAQKKAENFGTASSRASTLALFVGIPLPGTGAWTGTVIAFVLGMTPRSAFTSLMAGVVMSALIVTTLCELGWIGAGIAGAVLVAVSVTGIMQALQHE